MDSANRARVTTRVVQSSGTLRPKDRSLASVRLDETVESQILAKAPLVARTTLAIDLETISPAAPGAPDRTALLAKTVTHPVGESYGDGRSGGMFDQARLDGRNFEQLLAAIETEARDPNAPRLWGSENAAKVPDDERAGREGHLRERVGTFGGLVALLRQQAGAVQQAVAKVRAGSVAAVALMDGLAAAGTDDAQAALAALVLDEKLPPNSRVAAASSLIRVQHPGPRTVQALRELIPDPLLREHAVFGLGTAARRLREAGEADRAREISELLVGQLRAGRQRDDQIRCLRGIANSAYDGALESVRPFLSSADPGVRVAAVEATRLMGHPGVDAFITTPMMEDSETRVRLAAVQVAARRPPSAVLEAALSQVALHDGNVPIRQRAVELLGRWLPTRRNLRAVLEQVAAQDGQREVREAAKTALGKA